MKAQQPLPLVDQVEETRAEAEDRLERTLVPALENIFTVLSNTFEAARERLGKLRRAG